MAKIPLSTGGNGLSVNFGTTGYFALGQSGLKSVATEASAQVTYYVGGTLSDIYTNIATNTVNGTSTLRVRINGINGTQVVSITASTTGEFVDATPSNTDTVAANDEVNYSLITGGSSGAMTLCAFICNFAATTNTTTKYTDCINVAQAVNSSRYWSLADADPSVNATENRANVELNTGNTTFKYLFVYVSANTASGVITVSLRDDGVSVISASVTASTTGIFTETATSVNPATNSLMTFLSSVATGGTSITYELISVEGTSTDGTTYAISGNANGTNTSTTALNFTFNGRGSSASTNESQIRDMLVAGDVSNTTIFISANTANGTSTYVLQDNSVSTAASISIGASATGLFEYTGAVVAFLSTGRPSYLLTRGGTGTVTSRTGGAMLTVATGGGSVYQVTRMMMGMGM